MNRGTWIVPAVVAFVVASGSVTAAATRDVVFEFKSESSESRLTARHGSGVTVDKRIDRNGLEIALLSGSDRVYVTAGIDGTILIVRAGQRIVVKRTSMPAEYESRVRGLVRDSAAIAGLERMVAALAGSQRPEALSIVATYALVRSLQGDESGNALLVERSPRRPAAGMMTVAQPTRYYDDTTSNCWREYEITLERNYTRYSQCLRDYWWAQPVQYACALEWAMVAELALFHLISCVGGIPVS
jgi:hypothetical protein